MNERTLMTAGMALDDAEILERNQRIAAATEQRLHATKCTCGASLVVVGVLSGIEVECSSCELWWVRVPSPFVDAPLGAEGDTLHHIAIKAIEDARKREDTP